MHLVFLLSVWYWVSIISCNCWSMTICICCHLSSVMLCAFKVRTVQLLVKVLLLLILELYFLTYTESDGVGFRSSILPCMSVDFKADVFRSQMVIPAYFIKPNSGVCFQQLQLGILVDVVRFCLLGTSAWVGVNKT